jgi:hypothetical protein
VSWITREAGESLWCERGIALAIACVLAATIWFSTRSPGVLIDLFEQGHWLGPASDMLAGKVPYRDTFPVHGLLADGGLDYLLFKAARPSFRLSTATHHILDILFQPCIFLVAAAATRRPWLAALAIPLNLGLAIGVVFERPVVALLGLAAFLWAVDEAPRRAPAVLAGLLSGLAVFWGIEFAVFVLVAEMATIILIRTLVRGSQARPFCSGAFLLGLGAVLLSGCAVLTVLGALAPFLEISFVSLPRYIDRVWGVPFPAPWEILAYWMRGQSYPAAGGSSGIHMIGLGIGKRLYLAPLLGVVGLVTAYGAWRRYGPRPLFFRLVAVALACGLFFRYVISRFHFEGGNALAGPVLLLTLCVAPRLLKPESSRAQLVAVLVGMLTAFGMNGPSRAWRLWRGVLEYPRRMASCSGCLALATARGDGVLVFPWDAERLRALRAFTDAHVPLGGWILDLANQPALYFFLERGNPTRFYQTPLMAPFQDEVLAALRERPPHLVVLTTGTWLDAPDGRANRDRVPRVWDYVVEHYPHRVALGGTVLALPADRRASDHVPPHNSLENCAAHAPSSMNASAP